MTKRAPGFPDLDDSAIDSLVEAIRAAPDEYAKMDAMEPYVSWGERRHLLWELTRSGALDSWNQPELWSELANGLAWASGADVCDLLERVETDEETDAESGWLTSDWPVSLDELAMRAYAEESAPFEQRWESFPPAVRRGFELVLRRFFDIEREELSYDALAALARQHAREGLPMRILMVREGEVEEVELHDHNGPNPALYELIEMFGTREEWSRHLLDCSLEMEFGPPFKRSYDAWRVADLEELEQLLTKADIQPFARPGVYRLLVQERDDDPEDLIDLARRLNGGGYSGMEAEMCAVAAILKWKRRGEPAPGEAADLLTFKSVGRPTRLQDYYGLNRLIEALEYLPEERVVERIRERFGERFSRLTPFAVLRAVAGNDEVVEMALETAREVALEEEADFAAMHPVAHGFALAGPEVFEDVVAAHDDADDPLLRDTYHRAIVHLLADRAKAGHGVPEAYDRFISFVGWESPETDDYNFGHYILEDLLAIVANLPDHRVEALVDEELRAESPHWPRVLEALQHHPTDRHLEAAFERVDREGVPSSGGSFDWFERFLQALPPEHHDELGRAIAGSDSPDLHNTVRRIFGEERYEEFLDEYGGESSADTSLPEKVRRLAGALFEGRPDAEPTTIHFFERTGEPAGPEELYRVGGPPLGVSDRDWPRREDEENAPMTHMVTVGLEAMPGLRGRVDDETRAVALFVHNPQYNEAWEPFSSDAEVVQLTEADLASGLSDAGPHAREDAERFDVESVEVPREIFENPYELEPEERDPAVENLRDAVYQASARAGGAPIWLQGDQAPSSNFLFQFDEQFIPMNLGDMGVMYVFAETAFWQCH